MNTTKYTTKWEEIRANWVNGNKQDAKEMLYQSSKLRMLKTIKEAISDYKDSCMEGTYSGALKDLQELLISMTGN